MAEEKRLTHLNEAGEAHMVDVSGKDVTHRRAVAEAFVRAAPETIDMISKGTAKKGDVFATARIAGIMAAKKTADIIPLCHPIGLTAVSVELEILDDRTVCITAIAENDGKTGVEMEALTAAAVAALTVYDMCKAVDRGIRIDGIGLLLKEGGKSGKWTRKEDSHD